MAKVTPLPPIIATWHPAGAMRDKARMVRGFLIHCDKAASIARGKRCDPKPKFDVNPSATLARTAIASWRDGFACDIETPTLSSTRILWASLCGGKGDRVLTWEFDRHPDLSPFWEALASPVRKVFQNGLFDLPVLEAAGAKIDPSTIWDTMVEESIRWPDEPVDLGYIASTRLDVERWKHLGDPIRNAFDAAYTWKIYLSQRKEAHTDPALERYIERRSMPRVMGLIKPLNEAGVKLDVKRKRMFEGLQQSRIKTWRSRAERHFKRLSRERGENLKLPLGPKGGTSSKALQKLLYDHLGLPEKRSKEGRVTADYEALQKLERHDRTGTVSLFLEKSRVGEWNTGLKVHPDADGRVRTRFVLGGDEKHADDAIGKEGPGSGRLSSRSPNLQVIPEEIRSIFIATAPSGWLIKADFSQIEMRLIAFFSGDKALTKALEKDVYLWAVWKVDEISRLFNLKCRTADEVLADRRNPAIAEARQEMKIATLAWSYRRGARSFADHTGMEFKRAQSFIEAMNETFPGVVRWWGRVVAEVAKDARGTNWGTLRNPFGRLRHFFLDEVPAICNFLPQSTAADVLLDAQLKIVKRMEAESSEAKLVLTEHDESVIDAPDLEGGVRYAEMMSEPVEELGGMRFPVEVKAGRNWGLYHKHERKRCGMRCARVENLKGQRPWREWLR